MKNTNTMDTQILKQAAMSDGTLLVIFTNFLLAHTLFFLFHTSTPTARFHAVPDPFGLGLVSNPGEAMTLIPLTLALIAACLVRFVARRPLDGQSVDVVTRLVTLRTCVISLLSFSLGGLVFYIIAGLDAGGLLPRAAFGLLLLGLLTSITGLIGGQDTLRQSA